MYIIIIDLIVIFSNEQNNSYLPDLKLQNSFLFLLKTEQTWLSTLKLVLLCKVPMDYCYIYPLVLGDNSICNYLVAKLINSNTFQKYFP